MVGLVEIETKLVRIGTIVLANVLGNPETDSGICAHEHSPRSVVDMGRCQGQPPFSREKG